MYMKPELNDFPFLIRLAVKFRSILNYGLARPVLQSVFILVSCACQGEKLVLQTRSPLSASWRVNVSELMDSRE